MEEGELGLDEGKHLKMTMETTVSLTYIYMMYHHMPLRHHQQFETLNEKKEKEQG